MVLINTPSRYGAVAMTLHWLIAATLLLNIALGLYVAEIMADADPMHAAALQFHKSVGLTVLVLSLLRVVWRLVNPAPPLPRPCLPPQKCLAHFSHFLLYLLIVIIPLTGWAMVSASRSGVSTNYFGLLHWPNLPFFAAIWGGGCCDLLGQLSCSSCYSAIPKIPVIPFRCLPCYSFR